MKKLAVIVSGWHFPLTFYKTIAEQKVPNGWKVDLFCVSHRDPRYSEEEKKGYVANLGWSYEEVLDRILYDKIATVEEIERLGWNYKLYPNTVGDLGNTNQWLEEHDYKEYDVLLASHDDNLILNDRLFVDLLVDDPSWLVLTNSQGSLAHWKEYVKVKILKRSIGIRGSFEFFKKEFFDMLGGKFDLSGVTLSREGEFSSPKNFKTINNWNMVVVPLRTFIDRNGLASKIKALSDIYRVSDYCIEGERGFISSVQPEDMKEMRRGLKRIQEKYAALVPGKFQ
ncbi:hypothetical protein KW797_04510 [Candidatus Parcubacteria bacterium]|nr:hypothetical protein [Candidatus Parcubacteria bacterium]